MCNQPIKNSPLPKRQWGTVQRHCPFLVPLINDFYINLHLIPYYGVAGSFPSPTRYPPIVCGNMERWRRDWYNDNATDICSLIYDKNAVHLLHFFIHLGSNLSFSGDLTNEIQGHIDLASSAIGCLRECVFVNGNLTIHKKISIYDVVVISTILYGCETWVPYRHHIRLLESFHIRHLQLIPGLPWCNKFTHSVIRSRVGIPSIKCLFIHQRHDSLGHVIRMPDSRLPHRVLYGHLKQGYRSVVGQEKRFKERTKLILEKCNIQFNRMEALVSDRTTWQFTCANWMSYFDAECHHAAALTHNHRHQHAAAPRPLQDSAQQCPLCGRQFNSTHWPP